MAANRWQRVITVLSVASFLLTSCTSLQTVSIPSGETPPSLPAVKVGDTVVITTKAMEKKKFAVTSVEPDALVGRNVRVAYADMATLEVKRVRKGPTTAVVVVVVAVILGIVLGQELGEEFVGD